LQRVVSMSVRENTLSDGFIRRGSYRRPV
jgi:hypothetical protein